MTSRVRWFTSSYSSDSGGQCVEVAVTWRRSTYSDDEGGQCVEVATCPGAVHVRDSKDVARGSFTVTPGAWSAFLGRTN
ncbi:DUF397 domain-containing protein [Streptomyces sp. NBC_01497]|uniref:DUF397 domain-containing protein n=1 Tax=Streptomyces sp. NBC_01497 TaxID=2903885 RepID=UPI002E32C5B2|nr:DUF397 domain-containing protein [Streptomyces sp. NBC_01497]